jgi:hypothetical protein
MVVMTEAARFNTFEAVLKRLTDHGPATAAHVRVVSQQLTKILETFLDQECSEKYSIPAFLQLFVNRSIATDLVGFLLWSLPHLTSTLHGANTCGAMQTAWTRVNVLLGGMVIAGIQCASVQSTKAAAVDLLEQLQPALNLTKPGKHQHRFILSHNDCS